MSERRIKIIISVFLIGCYTIMIKGAVEWLPLSAAIATTVIICAFGIALIFCIWRKADCRELHICIPESGPLSKDPSDKSGEAKEQDAYRQS